MLCLPLAACEPPRVEIVVSGQPPEPTFACVDSDKPGSVGKQFTDLAVWRWDQIHTYSDWPRAVVWGVSSDHLLDLVVYAHRPPHVREFHAPVSLVGRTIYLVRVDNTHDGRSGQRHFGFGSGRVLVARDSTPEALADLARQLGDA